MVAKGCVDQGSNGRLKRGASRQPGKTFEPHGRDCQHPMDARCPNSVQPADDSMEIIGAGQFRFVLNGE